MLPHVGQHATNVPQTKQSSEDVFSISSVTDAQANETKDANLTELVSGQPLNKSGILGHLQLGSPLESVRELAEVEDTCELRVLGDGAGLFKEQMESDEIFPTTTIRYMSLSMERLGDALGRAIMESTTRADLVDSPMTVASSSLHEIPASEDASKASVNECQQVERCSSAMCGDQTGHQLTPRKANSGVFEVQLDKHPSVTPLPAIPNPEEERACPQSGVKDKAELDDMLWLGNKPNPELFQGHICVKEDTSTSVANQTEVLPPCKTKVEQREHLKAASFDLSAQLHSARVMAAGLQQRVVCLEHERGLQEKELQELTANLEKTSRALEARTSEMTTITRELLQLQLEREAKKNTQTVARTVTANGQPSLTSPNSSSSKLCTLL
ncbi:hypothetical protein NFI96_014728 [Prochilodus magdalenae]|nr:hypothetical protein NFI96_014728 [Prochilodus magdalenae]